MMLKNSSKIIAFFPNVNLFILFKNALFYLLIFYMIFMWYSGIFDQIFNSYRKVSEWNSGFWNKMKGFTIGKKLFQSILIGTYIDKYPTSKSINVVNLSTQMTSLATKRYWYEVIWGDLQSSQSYISQALYPLTIYSDS